MHDVSSIPGLSEAARNSEKQSGRAVKRARKSNPERTVAALAGRQSAALFRIFLAARLGAEAAGEKATSKNDYGRDWYIRERACHAVAYEKYFEILDSVVRAAELAAARTAGFRSWDAFNAARFQRTTT